MELEQLTPKFTLSSFFFARTTSGMLKQVQKSQFNNSFQLLINYLEPKGVVDRKIAINEVQFSLDI